MKPLALETLNQGRVIKFVGNETLVLNDPTKAYIITSGALQILGSRIKDGAASGQRRFMFTLSEHRVAFSCVPEGDNYALIGIAKGPTELLEVSVAEIEQALGMRLRLSSEGGLLKVVANDPGTFEALYHWVNMLGEYLTDGVQAPTTVARIGMLDELVFGSEDVISPKRGELLWFEMIDQELSICGRDMALRAGMSPMLATSALWFAVPEEIEEVELNTWTAPGPMDGSPDIAGGLKLLNASISQKLLDMELAEAEAERLRRAEAQQLLAQQTERSYTKLQSILKPGERFEGRGEALLTACSVVGTVQGMPIEPPAESEDLSRVKTPIEAIARSSKIRYRQIVLAVDWEKRDCGPLVAYLEPEEAEEGAETSEADVPVALLPQGGTWQYVHPERLVREPLTAKLRDRLKPEAYMFYRPLPHRMPNVLELIKFTTTGRRRDFLFIMVLGVIATLLGMITPKATGTLIDNAIPAADGQLLLELFLILVVAGIAGAIFNWIQMMATVRTGTNADSVSQSAMWDRLLSFRPDFFRRFSSGDLQDRVQSVSVITRELSGASVRPLMTGLLGLLNWLLLWYYSWELAKLALIVGLVVLVITLFISHFIRQVAWRLHDEEGAFSGLMIQMIGGVGKLRLGGAEQNAFNHWVKQYSSLVKLRLRIQSLQDVIAVINQAMSPVCLALIFWKGVDLIIGLPIDHDDHLTVGDFIAFNTAFVLYLTAVTDVSNTFVDILDNIVKGRRIQPLLDANPEVPPEASDPGRLQGEITLESTDFRYVEGGPQILTDISFTIHPGEFVAFVGPSGSGKSTLLRLLLGFDMPESGRVLYDGKSLAGLDVLAVRRQIGTVLQNGRLNAASILDNIANNSNITHGEAWEAVADAGFEKDLETMPMGLHTVISEGGGNLSGGQRQRLLIARALATRPKMVFFDEATSALDNKTQKIVSESLDRRKVTRVVVAHRLSTIRNADKIIVLDKGVLVQQGTFDELANQDGLFKALISRQLV